MKDQRTRTEVLVELALVILFYLLAAGCLVAFFGYREEMPRLFVYLGCSAVGVRIIYYVKKYFFTKY